MEQVFSEEERRVFAYHDGTNPVHGDPLAIWRRLLVHFGGDLNEVIEQGRSDVAAVWAPAIGRLVEAVRLVFDMVPFDPAAGTGATDEDCLAALRSWQGWLAKKKPTAGSSP